MLPGEKVLKIFCSKIIKWRNAYFVLRNAKLFTHRGYAVQFMFTCNPFSSAVHIQTSSHTWTAQLCVGLLKVLPVFFIPLSSTILEYFTVPTSAEVFSLPSRWFYIRSPWHFSSPMPTSAKLYNGSTWGWTTVYSLLHFCSLMPTPALLYTQCPPTFCGSCNGESPQIHPIFYFFCSFGCI